MDFLHDQFFDGTKIRVLTVADKFVLPDASVLPALMIEISTD